EIEVELDPDAEPESLDELDRAVTRAGAAPSRWPSKLRRMLGERFPQPGRAPKRPDTGVVVLKYLAEQFENLRRADLGVRLDVEDSVHQMRVSARKLRSALRTFRSVVPKTETAEIAAELKWLGSRLARARDVEVTQERLAKQLDAVPAELLLGPVRQFLTRHYGRVEAEVRAEAMDTLSGKRYRSLLRAIDALLADAPLTKRAHERPKPGLRKALRRAARRLGRAEAAARGLKGAERELALHEVRKKAKQARYAADAAKPTYGKKLRKWRKHVKAAQSTLGEHQDTVVARDALHRLAVAGFGEGQNTFVFGLLHGREEAAAAGHRKAFRKAWRKLKSGRRPGWLS
ncbi:MAG TPA: CHAD domain-containing protein, partial [Amycolatopsis sp.]|nr:CHAD domain-containing protein [Amycolatopsis sp.]